MKHINRTAILLAAVLSASLMPAGPMEAQQDSLVFGGLSRTYLLHVPERRGSGPMPLVLVLHGALGNARMIERLTGMSRKADAEGFMVVYPEGTGYARTRQFTWNAGNCCGEAMRRQADDTGFIRALLTKLKKEFPVDPDRVYAVGFSNGGIMAYRLACELSDELAAVAPVGGALGIECRPASPVSLIAFHGTGDTKVLYDGGISSEDVEKSDDKPVSFAIGFWARENRCGAPSVQQRGNVVRESYGCESGADVVLFTTLGQGHVWPGEIIGSRFEELSGVQDIATTDEIWDFFRKHPKARKR